MSDTTTVGELIAAFLEQCGVRTAFGVISIHNMPILDAIGRRGNIRYRRRARRSRGAQHGRRPGARVGRSRRRVHVDRHGGRQRGRCDGRGADRRHRAAARHRTDRNRIPRSGPRVYPRSARPTVDAVVDFEGRVPRAFGGYRAADDPRSRAGRAGRAERSGERRDSDRHPGRANRMARRSRRAARHDAHATTTPASSSLRRRSRARSVRCCGSAAVRVTRVRPSSGWSRSASAW